MKILSKLALVLVATTVRAEYPPKIANSDRIVTIEQWGGRGNEALVWAVRPTDITIYHIFSSAPDDVITTVSITKEESDEIRNLASGINTSDRGKIWFDANVRDGSMLRISFTANGDLRDDRIEVENNWRPEFQRLIEAVSKKAPEKWKIRFKERIAHLEQYHNAKIRCISVKDYYSGK
jgi:hypothetical protein